MLRHCYAIDLHNGSECKLDSHGYLIECSLYCSLYGIIMDSAQYKFYTFIPLFLYLLYQLISQTF